MQTSENTPSRDCLEIPDKLHSGLQKWSKQSQERHFAALSATTHGRSRAAWLFSRQSLYELK
jgi:hypothetical protein